MIRSADPARRMPPLSRGRPSDSAMIRVAADEGLGAALHLGLIQFGKAPGARRWDVGTSQPANPPNQPKWLCASSGLTLATGTSRSRPIAAAISRNGMPSSPMRVEWPAFGAALDRQTKDARRVERGGRPASG